MKKILLLLLVCICCCSAFAQPRLVGVLTAHGQRAGGAIVRLDLPNTTPAVLHTFNNLNPHRPLGGVTAGDGDWLYGMLSYNGTDHHGGLYKVERDGSNFTMIAGFNDIFGLTEIPAYHSDGLVYFANEFKIKKYDPVTNVITDFDILSVVASRDLLIDADNWIYFPTVTNGLVKVKTDGTLYTDLHSFSQATEGLLGIAGLTETPGDTIFGVQSYEGLNGGGTIYSIKKDGTGFTVHHQFSTATGARPQSKLVYLDGKLYGTTTEGGDHNLGVLYTINADGTGYRVLYHFDPGTNPIGMPNGNIAVSSNGRIFGTYYQFHINGFQYSRFYKIDTSGAGLEYFGTVDQREMGHFNQDVLLLNDEDIYFTTQEMGRHDGGVLNYADTSGSGYSLHHFGESANGFRPRSGLLHGSDGKIYGITNIGGDAGNGIIYSINQNGTGFTKLHEFNDLEGYSPQGKLLEASDGKLYGTCYYGGPSNTGCIYRLDKNGANFQVVYPFSVSDGYWPIGELTEDENGVLYGVINAGLSGFGGVYRIAKNGTGYIVLKDFGFAEIHSPFNGLYLRGNYLYGTCAYGGPDNAGGVYRVRRDGSGYEVLRTFASGESAQPMGALWIATNGKLYGTSSNGGANSYGTVFSMDTTGANYTILRSFTDNIDGSYPQDQLIQASDGLIYGTTFLSNINPGGGGVVFRMNLDGSNFAVVTEFNSEQEGQGAYALLDLNGQRALPVELLTFNAQKKDKAVMVTWKTAQEQHSSHFEVERSAGNNRYVGIGTVSATGNTTSGAAYSFTDPLPLKGNNFYRLKLVDDDGSFTYSRIVSLNFSSIATVVLSPNPARGRLHVQLPSGHGYTALGIVDVSGKQVMQSKLAEGSTGSYLDIAHLPAGLYVLQLSNGNVREQVSFIKK